VTFTATQAITRLFYLAIPRFLYHNNSAAADFIAGHHKETDGFCRNARKAAVLKVAN
jgi:hypothetical protein